MLHKLILIFLLSVGCDTTIPGLSSDPTLEPDRKVLVSWSAPTINADNTPLTDLDGYKIYHSIEPGQCMKVPPVILDANETQFIVDNLLPGTHYFVIVSFDTSGNESICSKEVSKLIE